MAKITRWIATALCLLILVVLILSADAQTVTATVQAQSDCTMPEPIATHLSQLLDTTERALYRQPESYTDTMEWYSYSPHSTHSGRYIGGIMLFSHRLTRNVSPETWAACGIKIDCPNNPAVVYQGYCEEYQAND